MTDNNFEIELNQSEELRNKGIVQKFVKIKKSNCIKIELNSEYKPTKIVIPINKKDDWLKFHKKADQILELKGINNPEHRRLIKNVFDDNFETILGFDENNY